MTRRDEAGFTLTEVLVVVAIIGVLAASAVVLTRRERVSEASRHAQQLVNETRRHAISGGPVRGDVVAATGITARSKLVFTEESGSSVLRIWDLVEDPAPATGFSWVEQGARALPREVQVYAVRDVAQGDGDVLPAPAATPPPVEKLFYPNGSADAFTIYLCKRGKCSDASNPDRWRVFVLPLAGVAQVVKGW